MNNTNNLAWLKTLSIGFAIVSFCIAIAVAGYVLVMSKNQTPKQNQQLTPSPTVAQHSPTPIDETANWETYQSKNNKYIFDYPSDLSIEVSSYIYLKKGPESNLSVLIEIDPEMKYVGEKEESFRDWAVEQFKNRCLAGGSTDGVHCDKVIKEISFTNKSGLKGYEIYLNQVVIRNNNQSSQTIGPMFVLDVSKKTNNSTYGLLIIPSYGLPDKNEEEITRKIVDTIRF